MDLLLLSIATTYLPAYLEGARMTILLSLGAGVVGIPAGALIGLVSIRFKRTVAPFVALGGFILCNVPLLVVLLWCHYPLQEFTSTRIEPTLLALILLSMLAALLSATCVRREYRALPRRYLVAAQVCGVPHRRFLLRVQLPLLAARLIPWFLICQIVVLHSSVMTSMISVEELFRTAQRVTMSTYRPIEAYSIAGVIFLLICLPLNISAHYLRRYASNKGLLER